MSSRPNGPSSSGSTPSPTVAAGGPLDGGAPATQLAGMVSEGEVVDAPGSRPAGPGRWRALRGVLVIAVLAAAAWYFRHLDTRALVTSLRQADWRYALAAASLNLLPLTAARSMRWRALLPPDPATGRPVHFPFLFATTLGAFAASNVLPFRAGEALRMAALRERYGHRVSSLVAVQIFEKLVEAMSLTAFALPVALWPRPQALPAVLGFAAGGGAVAYGVSRLAGARERAARWPWLGRVAEAVATLETPRAWAGSLGWALAADVVDITMIGLCLEAVGLHVGVLVWCAILVGVNVAALLPSSPGQIGLIEAGAVMVLAAAGVSQPHALAFALLYHASHLVPTTLGGGLVLAAGELARLRHRTPGR